MEIAVSACIVDDILLERYTYGPGHAGPTPVHVHDTYQWCLCLGGAGRYVMRGRRHDFSSGTLTVVHPGEPHSAHDPFERHATTTCLVGYLPVAATAAVIGELAHVTVEEPAFPGPVIDSRRAAGLFRWMWDAASTGAALEFDSVLWTLLGGVYGAAAPGDRRLNEPRAVSKAREFLHEHVADRVRLDQLGAVAGLSPPHLVRVFGRTVGVPPHRYHTWLRIEKAKRLLVSDRMSVGEVALAAGFHDHAHFARTFRRWVGLPPSRYRNVPRDHAKNVQDTAP